MLDNGLCRSRQEVVYFAGTGPSQTANCLENEVEVPDVRKLTLAEAQARVEAQPLTAEARLQARRGRCSGPGSSSTSSRGAGYRSSYDRIILVVSKATQGVIPNLVGREPRGRTRAAEEAEARAEDHAGSRATAAARCSSRSLAPASRRRRA